MVMDSTQIAQMTGSFNQQVMMGMQHSAMISQMYGGYAPNAMFNPVPTQGQQTAGMAAGMMGQMSMQALNNPSLNSFGGGMMQPFTSTGQHMIGQAMYGMQQQQMLDANMRQSFRFENGMGGRGFTQNQMQGIGQDLRSMAQQRGPGGETTNFEELGRLASNMGRMGMAEGVRSVKDFNEKFKQMLTSVKTIATELGTSLEEAQKVMASMKGSGVFSGQGAMASNMRAGSLAGGVSISEMSGMALIGSQISRAYGGLGSSGAAAGVEALTQIGSARKAGVINEQDIYNVTGLTGASGRRAFAQQNLQGDAQFFKGGLGRRMLAAVSGKDGKLDEEDVQAFLSGDVGTGETMRRAHENLSGVGRANFIRNEGRLRGEAMRAFGGLGRAVAARNWLGSRGMDMNEMDDRSMLFFQRKFNVGRDEADNIIKMARNLDRIKVRRQQSAENDQYSRALDRSQRGQSATEVLRRGEMFRQGVNDQFRQFGANLYSDAGMALDEGMQKSMGGYLDMRRADLSGDINQVYRGGSAGESALKNTFGLVRGKDGTLQQAGFGGLDAEVQAQREAMFGSGGMSKAQFNRFLGGQARNIRDAGYSTDGITNQSEFAELQKRMQAHQRGASIDDYWKATALLGGEGGAARKELTSVLAQGGVKGTGDELVKTFGEALDKLTTKEGKNLAEQFKKSSDTQQAAMISTIGKQLGISLGGGFTGGGNTLGNAIVTGGFATQAARDQAAGRHIAQGGGPFRSMADQFSEQAGDLSMIMGGRETIAGKFIDDYTGRGSFIDRNLRSIDGVRKDLVQGRESYAKMAGRAPRDLLKGGFGLGGSLDEMVTGGVVSDFMGDQVGSIGGQGGLVDRLFDTSIGQGLESFITDQTRGALGGANRQQMRGVGEFMRSKEGRGLASSFFSGDAKIRASQRKRSMSRFTDLGGAKGDKELSAADSAERDSLRAMIAGSRLLDMGKGASEKDLQSLADELGFDDVKSMRMAGLSAMGDHSDQRAAAQRQLFQGIGARANRDLDKSARRHADVEELAGKGKIGKDTLDFMQRMDAASSVRSGITGAQGKEQFDLALLQEGGDMQEEVMADIDGLSLKQRERVASEMARAGRGDVAGQMRRQISIEKRLSRSGKLGSEKEGRNIASMLGANFKKGELGTGAEALDKLSSALGLDELDASKSKDIEGELSKILSGKDMSQKERAKAIAGLQARPELLEAQQKKQDEQSAQNDPSYRALNDIKANTRDMAEGTTRLSYAINNLPSDIAKAVKSSPESGG